MKTQKLFLSLILFILMSGGIFPQESSVITTIDTLIDGRAIVTIEKEDSAFYAQYLMLQEPYNWIDGSISSPGDLAAGGNEFLRGTIEIPDEYGGCFPQDAVYNPVNNTFYIYAGRKVILIDGTTNLKSGEIVISNTDRASASTICLNVQKKIALNTQYAKLYCATEDGKIVIIDLSTNSVLTTIDPGIPLQQLIRASVIYQQSTNMAYYYVSTGGSTNKTGKIDGQSNEEISQNNNIGYSINDIVCNNNGTKLYVATNNGVLEYLTSDLSVLSNSFATGFNHLSLLYSPGNMLFSGIMDESELFYHDFSFPQSEGTITTSVNSIRRLEHNPMNNKLYCIGILNGNISENGIRIIDIGNLTELPDSQTYNFQYLMGLKYSSQNNSVFAGGEDVILSINGSDDLISQQHNTDKGFCSAIEMNYTTPVKILSIQNTTGNAILFNENFSSSNLFDIGDYIIGSCIKNNAGKLFIAASKNNYTGSLWVYDINNKTMINNFDLPIQVNTVSVTCNQIDEYVFITGIDENGLGKTCVFNTSTNSFLPSPIVYSHKIIKMLSAPNGKTYLCAEDPANTTSTWFYVIDESGIVADLPFSDNSVCFADMIYYDYPGDPKRVFIVSPCSMDIFVFNCDNNSWSQIGAFTNMYPVPHSIGVNTKENRIYVGNYGKIAKFQGSNYTLLDTYSEDPDETFSKLIINEYEKKIYAFTSTHITLLKDFIFQKEIDTDGGQDVIYNPLNDQLYLFNTVNSDRMIKVDVLNCYSDQITHTINTGLFYTFYKWNYVYTSYTETPSFTHGVVNNDMYSNNMPFSTISELLCYTDRIGLRSGWNWISFPRLERADNNLAPVIPVLDNINYFPGVNLELNENGTNYLRYYNNEWLGNLLDVISTEGYKLDLDILNDNVAPEMKLYGAILDPEEPITLQTGTSGNWVGYFIEDAQMPLDAIPADVLQHVTQIRAQNWAMFHSLNGIEPEWKYKGYVTPIHYGDMVIIYVDQQQTLVWNQPQAAAEEMLVHQTEYFEFEEQADYLPLFVETDANSDIQEIAVLAEGEVRGAAVRLAGDTLTQVSAYLGGVAPGTPLSFETWTGYKSAPIGRNGYAVYNPMSKKYENRTLYKGENARYHAVSLKSGTETPALTKPVEVGCAPNPFNSETTFTVRVNQTARVSLTIRDMNGRTVATLLDSQMPEGLYQADWDGTVSNGANAGNGVYYYNLTIDGRPQASGKVILIR